jgi:hypothetical protein
MADLRHRHFYEVTSLKLGPAGAALQGPGGLLSKDLLLHLQTCGDAGSLPNMGKRRVPVDLAATHASPVPFAGLVVEQT